MLEQRKFNSYSPSYFLNVPVLSNGKWNSCCNGKVASNQVDLCLFVIPKRVTLLPLRLHLSGWELRQPCTLVSFQSFRSMSVILFSHRSHLFQIDFKFPISTVFTVTGDYAKSISGIGLIGISAGKVDPWHLNTVEHRTDKPKSASSRSVASISSELVAQPGFSETDEVQTVSVLPSDDRIKYDPLDAWIDGSSTSGVANCNNGTKYTTQHGASFKFIFEGMWFSMEYRDNAQTVINENYRNSNISFHRSFVSRRNIHSPNWWRASIKL